MAFFVIPQAWIAPAIAAAALAFGPVPAQTQVIYRHLKPGSLGEARTRTTTIVLDKRPRTAWPREKAQCVIAHEYGHLAGRGHSQNLASLMSPVLHPHTCHRWLIRHGIR